MASEHAMIGELPVPARLVTLIDSGLWPRTPAEEMRQNTHSLVPVDRIHLFAPEEDRMYLVRPPFRTVAELRSGAGGKFWSRFGALEEISPELSVDIGDFGLGSDSPILLDYRWNRSNPVVIRLHWRKPQPNTWVRCAETFEEFADMLGLDS